MGGRPDVMMDRSCCPALTRLFNECGDNDCDDDDATLGPGLPELCDGVDNDCDGVIPNDDLDDDEDLVSECEGDCDATNDLIGPGVIAALTRLRTPTKAKRPGRVRPEPSKAARPSGKLDVEAHRDRIDAALGAGQCVSAQAVARELTVPAPDHADGWRLLGDAHRCSGRRREAVLAYRTYATLGGTDGGVLRLTEDLSGTLATLVVQVRVEDPAVVPVVRGLATAALASERGFAIAGSIAGGLGAVGLVVTGVFAGTGQRDRGRLGPWMGQ